MQMLSLRSGLTDGNGWSAKTHDCSTAKQRFWRKMTVEDQYVYGIHGTRSYNYIINAMDDPVTQNDANGAYQKLQHDNYTKLFHNEKCT